MEKNDAAEQSKENPSNETDNAGGDINYEST
jgi:hypothetical protein